MNTRIILTVLGSDRPGLTQALAAAVHETGGNWLESHLSHLGGKFVGSVLADVPEGKLASLEQAVRQVDASGLQVSIVFAGDEAPAKGRALSIELVGQDRPGIVQSVTGILGYGPDSVSVGFVEVSSADWTAQVYQPDIATKWSSLTKLPGYGPGPNAAPTKL